MKRWLLWLVGLLLIFVASVLPALAPAQPLSGDVLPPLPPVVAAGHEKTDRTGYIKGFYVSAAAMGNADFMQHARSLLEESELNAIVMDFKGDRGLLSFPSQAPLAKEIAADQEPMISDPERFLSWFSDRRIHTIARIVVFKDNQLAQARPDLAVTDASTGNIWRDHEGMGWVDPHQREVWSYNVALAVEAARLGFDEVQFDYVRFPTDGDVGGATFSQPSTYDSRVAAIAGLLSQAKEALQTHRVTLGADVFGYTAWVDDDLGIGQDIEMLAPHLDVLAPMVYPSTFSAGLPGEAEHYRNAIAYPYEIVRRSTDNAVTRARAVNPAIQVRPWLQDFPDYTFDARTYTPGEIRLQMEGALDGGGRGWMLWDPAVQYTRQALVSASPAFLPNLRGQIPILAYSDFVVSEDNNETRGQNGRTLAAFQSDLEYLLANGFYPVNLRNLAVEKLAGVPAGKRPVVLTFDGSTARQVRLLPGGAVDPACALGVLAAFHAAHPADWPLRATFFVQQEAGRPGDGLFGSSDLAIAKLQTLVSWGMEIGVLPVPAVRLDLLAPEEAEQALAAGESQIESWLQGYDVVSVALPDGAHPKDLALVGSGSGGATDYAFAAAVLPAGGLAPSPHVPGFDYYHIPRLPVDNGTSNAWRQAIESGGPGYVSSGE